MAKLAYDALLSLAQTIEKIIIHNSFPVSPPQKKELTCIGEHVSLLLRFLEDDSSAAEKTSGLEGRMNSVATDAESIIAKFMSEQSSLRDELPIVFSNRKFIRELKEVTNEIASIGQHLKDVGKEVTNEIASIGQHLKDVGNSSDSKDDIMVGFGEDMMAMRERVCGESSKLQVLPIFGMGGIGKTTLARQVYNDRLIMESFDVRAWVAVSQDYSVREIFSGLVVSLGGLVATRGDEEGDGVRVYKALKGRRYLIVLDDMWSTEAWDDVRHIFPDDGNGSRILLTTRLADVAAYPDPYSHLHEMQFMDADKSWELLRQKVFDQRKCPPELERIGREIARSCRGLPLAVVVIAGLIFSTAGNNLALWEEIAENVKSAAQGQIMEILSLSYSRLPYQLRQCFLYMASFPEDHEIHVSKLIKLWVAEGFCQSRIGSTRSLEEEGEVYLEDLVRRSLVLVNKRKTNGKIRSMSIHDLMRDLCIKKAREEKFLVHVNDRYVDDTSLSKQLRIVMSDRQNPPLEDYGWFRSSSARTLMFLEPLETGTLISCKKTSLLKVLNVFNSRPERCFSLPHHICEVIMHLRFLAFPVSEIPMSISNLQNLQTLIIPQGENSPASIRLPRQIWRMPKLRHIQIYACVLPSAEGEAFVSESLQTLSKTLNLVCTKQILDRIPNVKRLQLVYSDGYHKGDWRLDNLEKLLQLQSLTITLHSSIHGHSISLREMLSPVFPTSLRKLTLRAHVYDDHFVLQPGGLTMVGSLPNLQVLKLIHFAFEGNRWETNDGGFAQLETLCIDSSDLEHWITESSHFPRLKSLVVHQCWKLSEIPDDIGEIPTLELIELFAVHKSLVKWAERIQEEQQSFGNEDLQFRIYSWN